jgi:hypothetical protein
MELFAGVDRLPRARRVVAIWHRLADFDHRHGSPFCPAQSPTPAYPVQVSAAKAGAGVRGTAASATNKVRFGKSLPTMRSAAIPLSMPSPGWPRSGRLLFAWSADTFFGCAKEQQNRVPPDRPEVDDAGAPTLVPRTSCHTNLGHYACSYFTSHVPHRQRSFGR